MVIDARSYERQRGQERAGGAYARTYVRTYVKRTFVRMYVLFRLRTYARNGLRCGLCFTYVRTRTCVRTYCFTCHVRTHVRTYCFTCHRALRTVSPATYVRTYVLFHLPRTYCFTCYVSTYCFTCLRTLRTYARVRTHVAYRQWHRNHRLSFRAFWANEYLAWKLQTASAT